VLNNYIQEALANNQDLMVAISRVDAFIAKLQVAASSLYPQINTTINGSKQQISTIEQPFTIAFPRRFDIFSLLLNGSYYLDFWGKVRSMTEAAMAELFSSIETRRTVILTLITAVASTYIDILQIDEEILITKQTIDTRNQSYYLATVRFELGYTSKMEVDQALSEVEEATVKLYSLQIELAKREDLLINLLGKTSGKIKRGRSLNQLISPPSVPTYLPSKLLEQRPDILAAEQKLIAANANIGVAKANFFPQMNLSGYIGTGTSTFNTLFSNNASVWQYGISILQEIFTGGKLTGELKLARAQKEELLHSYESTILKAVQEVNDALISHKIALEQEKLQKKQVDTLKDYLYLAGLQYQNGLTDYLTFLDAERKFFNAELNYAEAQGYSFITLINIYKALGGGWVIEEDVDRTSAEK
jgi:multidrug efflux system outer membrane protein